MPEDLIAAMRSCALDEAGRRDQYARYHRLATTVTRVERKPEAIVVYFDKRLDRELLETALAVERGCCPFFVLQFEDAGQSLAISVRRPDQNVDLAPDARVRPDRWSSRKGRGAMSDSRVDAYAACLEGWRDEFAALRTILTDTELTEEFKWRKPCYTHAAKNIVIFQPMKDLCALMFFKGALLDDPKALLREQGENSRSSLRLEFRSVGDVTSMESALRDLVADAIRVEEAGLRVQSPTPPTYRDYPDELAALMEADPAFRDAFERLTPGRQRGYLLHFNAAKQSSTRAARIERVQDRIMEGFGMHD